jgi:hypothetical protein
VSSIALTHSGERPRCHCAVRRVLGETGSAPRRIS